MVIKMLYIKGININVILTGVLFQSIHHVLAQVIKLLLLKQYKGIEGVLGSSADGDKLLP